MHKIRLDHAKRRKNNIDAITCRRNGFRLRCITHDHLVNQILEGNSSIVGMMLESNLHWGNQPIPADRSELRYGVSVTDACVDWETTEGLLQSLDARLRSAPRFAKGPAAA